MVKRTNAGVQGEMVHRGDFQKYNYSRFCENVNVLAGCEFLQRYSGHRKLVHIHLTQGKRESSLTIQGRKLIKELRRGKLALCSEGGIRFLPCQFVAHHCKPRKRLIFVVKEHGQSECEANRFKHQLEWTNIRSGTCVAIILSTQLIFLI